MDNEIPLPANQVINEVKHPARWRVAVLVVAVLVGLALLPLFFLKPNHPKEVALLTVAVAKVVRTNLVSAVEFDGEFRPYLNVDLHAKVAGFVSDMLVDIGDQVQSGQLLATLEVPELQEDIAHAQAVEKRSEDDVLRKQAAYVEAHLADTRLVGVNKAQPNLVAQQDLDDAQAKDQSAAAAVAEARHDVQVAQADVARLNDIDGYTRITAPFSGVITKREADPGALIPGGTANSQTMPLLRISQNDLLRLMFPVSLSYVSLIRLRQPVNVQVPAPSQSFTGTVARFTRDVNDSTRAMDVEVDVPNPDLTLVPGMYATVTVEMERRDQVLAVPTGALARKKIVTVYRVNAHHQIQEQTVTLGLETATMVEVTSGLNDGDLVLVGSRSQVQPGQTVEPKLVDWSAKE